MKSLKSFRLWLGLALSAGSIAFLIRSIDPAEVWEALQSANYLLVIPSIAFVFGTMLFKAIRWQFLFGTVRPRVWRLFSALLVGYMANAILPARLGELVRAYNIGQNEQVSTSQALSTIVVEKVLDVGTVLLILVILVPLAPLPDWAFRMGLAGAALVVMLLVLVVLLAVLGERLVGFIVRFLARMPGLNRPQIEGHLLSFVRGFSVLRDRRLALPVAFWSVMVWAGAAAINYVMLLAFFPRGPLLAALFVLAVTNLGMAVPSAPGYIGVFHYLVVLSLTAFGLDRSLSLSYALVVHASTFGSFVISGLIIMWKEHFSLAVVDRTVSPTEP